jgi:hypothetical protein
MSPASTATSPAAETSAQVDVRRGAGEAIKDGDAEQQENSEQGAQKVGFHDRFRALRGVREADEAIQRDAGQQESDRQDEEVIGAGQDQGTGGGVEQQCVGFALAR